MAEFYGFNPFELSPAEAIGLWANMPRLQARRTRERLQAAGATLTVDQVRELTLFETGSEDKAQQAASDYMAAQLKAGITPE